MTAPLVPYITHAQIPSELAPEWCSLNLALRETALEACEAGISINPPRQDGSKAPFGESDVNHRWDLYTKDLPTLEQVHRWYDDPSRTGIGLICGSVSGNLEALDFDDRSVYLEFRQRAAESGLGPLLDTIESSYMEYSPNGVHLLYRCSQIDGSKKLATRPKSDLERRHPKDTTKTLIESRGEGGFLVIAPTYGSVNPSGVYVRKTGSLSTIPTITPEQRSDLLELARSFHVVDPKAAENADLSVRHNSKHGNRPGDDFNARTSWASVLAPHGWKRTRTKGGTDFWLRPGKEHGVSASTNHGGSDLFCCFSTSTNFEPQRGYTKFTVYSMLDHNGDFSAAARALALQGYGAPLPILPKKMEGVDVPDLLTDMRIAEYFAARFLSQVRYWAEADKWLINDGRRWSTDSPGGPYPFIKLMIRELFDKINNISDPKRRTECLSALIKLESHPRQKTIVAAAEKIPPLIIRSSDLDRNPMLLNVRNGTLDLFTGELRPHCPDDYITRLVNIDYDLSQECPVFLAFIDRVLAGNIDLIAYLQRYSGYALTGRTDEQILLFLYGEGSNGKTTLANVLETLMFDFATTAGSDLLMHRDMRSATNDIAAMRGVRLVKVSEIDDGERLAEAQIKTLTGGDRITCRFLYEEFFQYTPCFKILLLGNYKPKVRGRDHGIWRRIHLLPFSVTISEAEKDPYLQEKLVAELPGILAWAVRGCLSWQKTGLKPPAEVLAEVDQYRKSEDVFQQWLDDRCKLGQQHQSPANVLLKSFIEYSSWRHMSPQKFGRLLAEHGFVRGKSSNAYWSGLTCDLGDTGGYDPF